MSDLHAPLNAPEALGGPPRARPLVHKLGGAALADGARVRAACERVLSRGGPCVVVVSAALGVTDELVRAAEAAAGGAPDLQPLRLRHRTLLRELDLEPELCDRHLGELALVTRGVAAGEALRPEQRDHVLSLGERISARIVSAVLRARGFPAVPMDAFDLGLSTDSRHGAAAPLPASLARMGAALERALENGLLPVVTGFVAADPAGRLTTLGRDGSDLTAALVAAALRARELLLWKAVGGVLTADPRLVPQARPLRALSYAQAEAMAALGAKVLHSGALAPLAAACVPARVLAFAGASGEGTRIGATGPEGAFGVAAGPASGGECSLALVGGALHAEEALALVSATTAVRLLPQSHGSARFAVPAKEVAVAARLLHARFLEAAAARSPAGS